MLFHKLTNFRIGTKIYTIVGLLSVVSMIIAVLALLALTNYNLRVGEMQNASQRSFIGEQINSMIYAVVMDSTRCLYGARRCRSRKVRQAPVEEPT